jgi:hypothetical protein
MFKIILFVFICCFSVNAYSQSYIGLSKEKTRQKLEKYLAKYSVAGDFLETDSTTLLSINDTRNKPASFVFVFSDNKCIEEKKLACDSCVMKYLSETLADKRMEWRKINDSTYLSKYSKHLMMVININGAGSSLQLRKTNWNRKTYQGIVKSL